MAELVDTLEALIAARTPVRVVGCMPHLAESGPDAPFPYVVVAPIDHPRHVEGQVLPLDEVVDQALDEDLGLGLFTADDRFTTVTYGHLWSYVSRRKLVVPPAPPPPGFVPDLARLRYWSPDADVFPAAPRRVLRAMLAPLMPSRAPKAVLCTDAEQPWFTSLVFNVYRDELPTELHAALHLALRWHVPAHLAINVFRSSDPVAARFDAEPAL